jgi:hypothetical protein
MSGTCPKSEECGNQQPEQSLHEKEEKTPEAQSFYPGPNFHLCTVNNKIRPKKTHHKKYMDTSPNGCDIM